MISTIADTRNKALALGRKACQCFPPSQSIAGAVKSVLDSPHDEKHTKGSHVCAKLTKLVKNRDQLDSVPQMWAVIILLCNSSSVSIVSWSGLTSWLQLIQLCFNGSDPTLRTQANLAWNRFIYVARPHEGSNEKLTALLAKPVIAQLERNPHDTKAKITSSAATSTYCNLLYYAMRPTVAPQRLNKLWDEYIVKVMRTSFLLNASNADMACRILMSLFWNWKPTQKLWTENRAHENRLMDPDELPTLDCKWVRSRAVPITKLFAALFKHCSWGRADSVDQAYVSKAWRSFVKSVRSASVKEIKMTTESRTSIAAILDFVDKLSTDSFKQDGDTDGDQTILVHEVLSSLYRTTTAELHVSAILEVLEADSKAQSTPVLYALIAEMQRSTPTIGSTGAPKQHVDSVLRLLEVLNAVLIGAHVNSIYSADLLCKGLSLLMPEYAEDGLSRLAASLALNVRDESRAQPSSAANRLAQILTRALGSVGPPNVEKLDAVFAAAFGSVHRTIVSSVSDLWNNKFGGCDDLHIGPLLTDALQRLRPYVELRMPPGCMDSWTEVRDSIPSYETQDSMPIQELRGKQEPLLEGAAEKEIVATVEQEPAKDLKKISSATTRAKPRHADSQVAFVPIDSSPPAEVDSQHLTEHQREVRDKQRSGPVVVFADLRSSPRPASRAPSESRDCGLARKAAGLAGRPSTPPLPDQGDELEIQPSPTPKSRYARNIAEVEIPSSPPSMHGHQAHNESSNQHAVLPARNLEQDSNHHTTARSAMLTVQPEEAVSKPDEIAGNRSPLLEAIVDHAIDSPFDTHDVDSSEVVRGTETPLVDENAEMYEAEGHKMDVDEQPHHRAQSRDTPEVPESESGIAETPRHKQMAHVAVSPKTDLGAQAVIAVATFKEAVAAVEAATVPEVEAVSDDEATGEVPRDIVAPETVKDRSQGQNPKNASSGAVLTTPQRQSSRIDSVLQQMSASQLSNDLDWSVVLEGLNDSPVPYENSRLELAIPLGLSQTSQGGTSSRKRKSSSKKNWSRSKKRKTQETQSASSRESQESFIKTEAEEGTKVADGNESDGSDVIEVIVPSSSPEPGPEPEADADGDMFVDAPESQDTIVRKRGRPARVSASSLRRKKTPPSSQASQQPASEGTRRSRRSIYSQELEDPPHLQPEVQASGETEHPAEEQMRADNEATTATDVSTPAPQPINVLESLQKTLDAVKNAPAGSLDLRAVDELCFQIRFQAQLRGAAAGGQS
ncbi:Telomere length regulator protein rif1 [Cyphellophora attinorum]|uniref:Telomere length regulator protein rif1 n=1 Tax=Cyphellophora attinorum TaxID=1664694 RepID=A0A0N1HBV6_9EURO|nr:Telomere length regulator protein rif1 [Phialophora attinorum]KPI45777.1 Telomere length regulator protein rif1 [Phialophora attinorum]